MNSFGVRLAILLAVTLFSVMALAAWWGGRHQAEMLHHEEVEEAEALAATLAASLDVVMENGKGALARNWQDRMRGIQGIEGVEVLRRDGAIAFRDTSTIKRVNRYLGMNRFQRSALPPALAAKPDQASARRVALKGRRVISKAPGQLQLFIPIRFKPACIGCHGYDKNPVRGVLHLKFSTRNAEARVKDMRQLMWGLAAAASLLLGIALWAGLGRLVLRPIEQLRRAMQYAGAGDRSHRLRWSRRDELGEVAAGFNTMQKELQARNALIHAVVKHAPNAIIAIDAAGAIRSFNPAAEHIFGYTAEEASGKNVRMLMPEPYQSAHDGYIHRYLETGEAHIIGQSGRELTGMKKDGHTFPLEIMVAEIRLGKERHFLGILHDITERKKQQKELAHLATHDRLTGLINFTELAVRMDDAIARGQAFTLFYLRLDRFNVINEVLGHSAGNQVLVKVGKRLTSICNDETLAAHIGGSIFAIFWPDTPEAKAGSDIAQKLQSCLEQPLQLAQYSVDTEASIGIVCHPGHGKTAEDLMRCAEVAMEAAKRQQTAYAIYDEKMEQFQVEHLALAGELRHAIEAGELLLHYQPKVDMQSGRIAGVEALVRWRHPQKGLIQPDMFIPVAEESSLIHPFTAWVLNEAVCQAARWRQKDIHLLVAINLATRNLAEAALPEQIGKVLAHWKLPPDHLMLEITERGLMADPVRTRNALNRIRALGVPVSIDDFGTGYSSLAYLKDLPVDELKVDQSFICAMSRDAGSRTIVQATITLAHNLGLTVTAEGVESEAEWDQLAAMHCDRAQGYYMGRPMPADEFERWLTESSWGTGAGKGSI